MKIAVYFLLIASLATNLFFGRALWSRETAASSTTKQKHDSTSASQNRSLATAPDSPNHRLHWQRLGSNDLSQLVKNLRAANLSPRKIAYIVHHLLNEKYATMQEEVAFGKETPPYWRGSDLIYENSISSKQRNERRVTLWHQRSTEEAQLLGDDYWTADGIPVVDHFRNTYGDRLSNQKLSAIQNLEEEYSTIAAPFIQNSNAAENREKLKLIDKEYRADIAKLLTPDELLERDLRYSNAANLLQTRCNYFTATETEFRALFPIYEQIDKTCLVSNWDEVDEKTRAARKDAEARAQAQIEALLGPARYAEFKQANDETARKENQLVTRLGLPLTAATHLVSIKSEFATRTELVRKDNSLPPGQRTTQLAALKSEAENRITAILGDRGLQAYQQSGGKWMQTLTNGDNPKQSP